MTKTTNQQRKVRIKNVQKFKIISLREKSVAMVTMARLLRLALPFDVIQRFWSTVRF